MAWLFGSRSVSGSLSNMASETIIESAPKVKSVVTNTLDALVIMAETAQDALIMASTGEESYDKAINAYKKRRNLRRSLWDDNDTFDFPDIH